MFLGLFLVADTGVRLFLTAKWVPVILPLKILCVVSCLRAIETMNAPLLLAKARPRIILWNNLLQAIVMPIAFYVGTRYGLAGVSIAWLITWPILFAIVTWQTLSLIDLTFADYFRRASPLPDRFDRDGDRCDARARIPVWRVFHPSDKSF